MGRAGEVTAKVTQYTALLIASMFCFKIASEISRIAFFLFYFFAITLVFVFRSIYKGFLLHVAKKSINTKRLVILTMAENVEEIKKRLGMDEMWNYLLKGLILLNVPDTAVGTECCGIPILGNYNNMYDCVTQRVVDEIFIHIPYSEGIQKRCRAQSKQQGRQFWNCFKVNFESSDLAM
ncbi:MAG: nucleoside-diphosphate sugar epimerase/dehydratase [Mediterraneibacter gnavus]